MTSQRPFTVALIGGIGSGKSAVAAEFARRGAAVIDADVLGHEALRRPEVRDWLLSRYGPGILTDGEVNRRELGRIVFADAAQRTQLERIVHPHIQASMKEQIAAAGRAGKPLVVLDAAVLLEAGWDEAVDRILYIDAPDEIRRQRVAGRGWSEQEWRRREANQMPLTRKRENADHVIDNSTTPEHLTDQVADLMRSWRFAPASLLASE